MTDHDSEASETDTAGVLDLAPYAITHYHAALVEVAESVRAFGRCTAPASVSRRLWSAIEQLRDAHAPGDDILLAEQICATLRRIEGGDAGSSPVAALETRLDRLTALWQGRLPAIGGHC